MTSWNSGYVTDVDYTHGFYKELAPNTLSFTALLSGYNAPGHDLEPLNYCELGCGQGYTTSVLAASNPHIQFYANDFNPSHIASARALARTAQLSNVHFSDDSFGEYLKREDLPEFDYIVLHGIYSWVSAEARKDIVRFIRNKLKPGGVAYLSYNCMPGWASAMPLRRLMVEYADHQGDSRSLLARIGSSLEFVEKLSASGAMYFARNPDLAKRLEAMKKHGVNYLAHEYFNRDWNPFYFMDVAEEMSEAKLTWIGSAGYIENLDTLQLTQEQRDMLAGIESVPFRETLRDHMLNKQFRKDLFMKGPVRLSKYEAKEKWSTMRFMLTNPEKLSVSISGMRHSGEINSELFESLIAALKESPRTVGELIELPGFAHFKLNNVTEALAIFIDQSGCRLCLPEEGEAERKISADLFNKAIAERAHSNDDLKILASGRLGNGVHMDRVSRLVWLAAHNQEKDLAKAAWGYMKNAELQINAKDGRSLKSEEAEAEVLLHLSSLEKKALPLWKASGLL